MPGTAPDAAIAKACKAAGVALAPAVPRGIGPGVLDLRARRPPADVDDEVYAAADRDTKALVADSDCAGLARCLARFSSDHLRTSRLARKTKTLATCELAAGRHAMTPALRAAHLADLMAARRFADVLAVCLWIVPPPTPDDGRIYPVACGVAACRVGHLVWVPETGVEIDVWHLPPTVRAAARDVGPDAPQATAVMPGTLAPNDAASPAAASESRRRPTPPA